MVRAHVKRSLSESSWGRYEVPHSEIGLAALRVLPALEELGLVSVKPEDGSHISQETRNLVSCKPARGLLSYFITHL